MSTPSAERQAQRRNTTRDWGYRAGRYQLVTITLTDADVAAIDEEVSRRRRGGDFLASRANVTSSLVRCGLICVSEAL